jgi:hypothetical protein
VAIDGSTILDARRGYATRLTSRQIISFLDSVVPIVFYGLPRGLVFQIVLL